MAQPLHDTEIVNGCNHALSEPIKPQRKYYIFPKH